MGRGAAAHQGVELSHHPSQSGSEGGVPGGRQQLAYRQAAVRQPESPDGEDGGGQQRHQDAAADHGATVHLPHLPSLRAQFGQRCEDPGPLTLRGSGRGDGSGATERLDKPGRDVRLGVLIAPDAVGGSTGEDAQQPSQQREPGEEHGGQPDVGEGQGDQGTDRSDQGGETGGRGGGCGPGVGGVSGEAGHQVTGGEAVDDTVRCEGHQMVDSAPAEPGGAAGGGDAAGQRDQCVEEHLRDQQRGAEGQRTVEARTYAEHEVESVTEYGGQGNGGSRGQHAEEAGGGGACGAVPKGPGQDRADTRVRPAPGGRRGPGGTGHRGGDLASKGRTRVAVARPGRCCRPGLAHDFRATDSEAPWRR